MEEKHLSDLTYQAPGLVAALLIVIYFLAHLRFVAKEQRAERTHAMDAVKQLSDAVGQAVATAKEGVAATAKQSQRLDRIVKDLADLKHRPPCGRNLNGVPYDPLEFGPPAVGVDMMRGGE
ncbi:MAG: hypothetical protein ACRC1K_21580 [Planctomycetia bacterium]